MKISKWIVVVAVMAGVCSFAQAKEQSNILLIIADDLGPHLGCYGDANAVSPHIDRLAAEGVRFEHAHVTAASCSPSRGSIFTGLYPHQNGMFSLSQLGWARLDDGVPKLPNEMKKLGYRTAIIGKTHYEPETQFEWDLREVDAQKVVFDRDVRWMNAQAAAWLESSPQEKPFLLCMSYVDPHRGGGDGVYERGKNEKFPRVRLGLPEAPLPPEETVPVPFLGYDTPLVRLENSDYYACIQRLDTGVGELMAMLEQKGVLDNTLIVFIGDHGPDMTRGKMSAYATATHIPMLVRWPGHAQAGLVRGELVSTIDLFPTFVQAAGGALPDERQTGLPLQPLLEPGAAPWRTWLGTEFIAHVPWHYYPRYAVLSGGYQFVHNLHAGQESPLEPHNYCYAWWEAMKPEHEGSPLRAAYDRVEAPPEFELYNVANDPLLVNNLAASPEQAERMEAMAKQVQAWRENTRDPFLDPAFGKAYGEHVIQQKTDWEIQHGLRKAPPKKAFPKVGKKIDLAADFTKGIPKVWKSPNGHPGQTTPDGISADLSKNGFSMTRSFDAQGIGAGTVEASAVFVQSETAAAHSINWNIGFSSENKKYIQNMNADTVCVRFITAGKNKGRFWWSIYNDGQQVGKSWSANFSKDWKAGDEIRLTLSFDVASGEATAVAENLSNTTVLAKDSVTYAGITGLRYTGFEMTMFPKGKTGSSGAVKSFRFNSMP